MQKICVVIPCYNEGSRLPVQEFSYFIGKTENVYFCFVNDGSNDNTMEVLTKLENRYEDRISVINHDKNRGKAEAVRTGILVSLNRMDFDILGYLDADLSTPLSEIFTLQNHLNIRSEYQIAFGSRIKRIGSLILRKAKRHYLGRIFSTFASLMLQMDVYDTQCGAKLFKKDIALQIFNRPFVSKWLFDIEIFFRVINIFGREEAINIMIEVPLNQWTNKSGSKISLGYMFKVPFEMLRIYNNRHK